MPDLNDFYAFKSTSGGSSSGGGDGCSWRVVIWGAVIVGIIMLIVKCYM